MDLKATGFLYISKDSSGQSAARAAHDGAGGVQTSDSVNSGAFRDGLQKKYGIVIKVAEKMQFNGNRISPHIFNTEKD